MSITVRVLHPALGAEIRGVDLRVPMDEATFHDVHDAWMRHLDLHLAALGARRIDIIASKGADSGAPRAHLS